MVKRATAFEARHREASVSIAGGRHQIEQGRRRHQMPSLEDLFRERSEIHLARLDTARQRASSDVAASGRRLRCVSTFSGPLRGSRLDVCQQPGTSVHGQPLLPRRQARDQESQIRAGARGKVQNADRRVRAHRVNDERGQLCRTGCRISRLPGTEPDGQRFIHWRRSGRAPPRKSRAASSQVRRRARARRAPAASRERTSSASLPSTRSSAAASAGPSPGGTRSPASGPTRSGMAPVVVLTTGRPRASASATAMPYVSCSVARTKTSAAS